MLYCIVSNFLCTGVWGFLLTFTCLFNCDIQDLQPRMQDLFFFYFSIWTLGYCIWDLVAEPGIKPGAPALGAWSLSHWATRKNPWNWPPSARVKALGRQQFWFSFCSQMHPGHLEQCLAHNSHLTCIYFGEGNGNSLQYSCLGYPMDRGAWWATVHGVTKSWTRLSD